MYISRKITLAALFAPALMASAAFAAEPGFYIGASGGQTTVDQDAKDLGINTNDNSINDFKIDDDDTGWKAFLGYQFLPWLGIEAGYVDFGGVSNGRNIGNSRVDTDVDLTGINGYLVGTIPIGPVDLFAKVGAIDLQLEGDVKINGDKTSDSENDTQLAYGIGAAYNFGRGHWGLRVEAEGFDDNEVDDFYFLSAGLTYRFFSDKVEPVAAATPVAAAPEKCSDTDNDGVCDSADQCPNTPHGVRVDSIGCDCDFSMQLQFEFDSAKLSASDMAQLDNLVAGLKDGKIGSISGVVDGFTDSVGSESYNLGLSKRRAQSVVNYLQSQGVNLGGQFTVNGFGEANPIASNDTAEGRALNRRVVIRRTDCGS
jgi:OOP family OmpA-OmpF porin